MRIAFAVLALVTLAACGADGAPKSPSGPGVSITGQAQIGVTGS